MEGKKDGYEKTRVVAEGSRVRKKDCKEGEKGEGKRMILKEDMNQNKNETRRE
jgi:hypothetical protein